MAGRELIKNILTHLFEELNVRGIDYCILKNYKELPDSLNSGDVDILIDKNNVQMIKSIFKNLAKQFNIEKVSFSRKGNVNTFTVLSKEHSTVVIDFWTGIEWYIFPIMSNNNVFKEKLKYKFFFVASPIHEIMISWLVPFMVGGKMKEKYAERFLQIYNDNRENMVSELLEAFGKRLAQNICQRLDSGNLYFDDLRNSMRAKVFFLSLKKNKSICLTNFFRLSYDVIRHYLGKYPIRCI